MRDLDEVRRIVLEALGGHPTRVYLFGSWARGSGSRISDIDGAVDAARPLPRGLLAEDRNLTVHTYNEELAEALYARLPEYSRLMKAWLDAIAARTAAGS